MCSFRCVYGSYQTRNDNSNWRIIRKYGRGDILKCCHKRRQPVYFFFSLSVCMFKCIANAWIASGCVFIYNSKRPNLIAISIVKLSRLCNIFSNERTISNEFFSGRRYYSLLFWLPHTLPLFCFFPFCFAFTPSSRWHALVSHCLIFWFYRKLYEEAIGLLLSHNSSSKMFYVPIFDALRFVCRKKRMATGPWTMEYICFGTTRPKYGLEWDEKSWK